MTTRRRILILTIVFTVLHVACAIDSDGVACDEGQVKESGVCVPVPASANDGNTKQCPEFNLENKSILHYLNPRLFEDPQTMDNIAESLQNGELVVINDAFLPEYADAMHCDLDTTTAWKLNTYYENDGFHFHHHNIYDHRDYSELMNDTLAMFEHPESKQWMEKLSNRDCSGEPDTSKGSASYYKPGDHSLPHTDFKHQRTVAYVWHLSKNWQPEWGGALYWAPEQNHHAFVHASYNTLSLFSVHADTPHFVTTVSPEAKEKRLSFNGWWTSGWYPHVDDDLEEYFDTPEKRWDLTSTQYEWLYDLIYDYDNYIDEERREGLIELMNNVESELWPEYMERKFEI